MTTGKSCLYTLYLCIVVSERWSLYPFILPPKVRNGQNFWWGKIYPVLISYHEIAAKVFSRTPAPSLSVHWHWWKQSPLPVSISASVTSLPAFFEFAVLAQPIIISDSCFHNFLWAFVAVFGWVRFFPLYFRYPGSDRRTCCFLIASAWEIKS